MTHIRNIARERLEAGELAIGMGVRQARSVDIGKIMKTCGYDWLFIDMEHGSMSVDDTVQISIAAADAGITPIVRVPGFQHFHATRVLDGGALGVVFPHVDTAEIANELANFCRYPPRGHRSVVGALPQIDFRSLPVSEATQAINNAVLVVVMLESPEAIERVEEIAAVDGVDVLLVGTGDLCMEMGIPGQVDSPKVVQAYEKLIAACHRNGKYPGLGGVYKPELMESYIGMGMRFILSSNDLAMMMAASTERASFLRGLSVS
ncbi:MAG: aldolase/citrate lyase family protein [Alphaproteobacteria bacterium]|nr:aldolase [Alphaproteobacteria bacterium]HIB56604.1 aldolase [Alphaproteobacteria bacterium]